MSNNQDVDRQPATQGGEPEIWFALGVILGIICVACVLLAAIAI